LNTHTILVVDDDVDIRASLCDFLEDEGYTIATAANGRDALDYLRGNPAPSVVLLDLMMPIMDGYEFRTEQKRDPAIAAIPVVVMTARGTVGSSDLDVEQVLQKSLKLPKLLDALQRAARTAATPRP
jgi:CheY-like chemotaxis protein